MSRMYRLAGTALVLGSLLWLVNLLYGDTVLEGFRPSHAGDSTWGVVGLVGLVGSLLAMVGIFAVYARQADRMDAMGTWGFGLAAMAGMIFGVGFGAVSTIAVPLMSSADRSAWDFYGSAQPPAAIGQLFLFATLLYVLGTVMWGWSMTKAAVWPTWTGWGLVVSGVLALLMTVGRLAGVSWMPLVADIPYLLFMVLGIYWGWRMAEPMRAMQPAAAAGVRA